MLKNQRRQFTAYEQPADDAGTETAGLRFATLFRQHGSEILNFLTRKLGSREEASEATQEVFLKYWNQERQGHLEGSRRGYLFTIAFNIAKDCRRRARVRVADKHEPIVAQDFEDEAVTAEEAVLWRQGLDELVLSLRDLPVETRKIFLLYHGQHMSYVDIAEAMGISTRTVERHMAKAIAHCRGRMTEYL